MAERAGIPECTEMRERVAMRKSTEFKERSACVESAVTDEQDDIFDPRTWVVEPEEYRLYTCADCSTWCYLDYIDYVWAIQWCWHINKPHPGRKSKKLYVRRTQYKDNIRSWSCLHVEVMKRTGIEPTTVEHTLADHIDGDESNCRRNNLRWTTHAMNSSNQYIKGRTQCCQ